jgi:hypothetical protein
MERIGLPMDFARFSECILHPRSSIRKFTIVDFCGPIGSSKSIVFQIPAPSLLAPYSLYMGDDLGFYEYGTNTERIGLQMSFYLAASLAVIVASAVGFGDFIFHGDCHPVPLSFHIRTANFDKSKYLGYGVALGI